MGPRLEPAMEGPQRRSRQRRRSSMFIRPVKPSDVEPLMDMLLDRDQFDQDGLHHVQKTLTHYFSGQSADLWFSAEHLGLAGIAYCASEMMTNDV